MNGSGYSARVIRVADVAGPEAPPQPSPTLASEKEAASIVARAEARAEAILSEARRNAEALMRQAELEASQAAEKRVASELLAFQRKTRMELDEIRPLLVRIVLEAVEAIVGALPADELAERIVKRGLRDMAEARDLILYTARADHPAAERLVRWMAERGERSIVAVMPDSDLQPGVSRLESGGLSIELGLKSQIEILEAMLLLDTPADATPHAHPDRSQP